jgi:hypothetical protein
MKESKSQDKEGLVLVVIMADKYLRLVCGHKMGSLIRIRCAKGVCKKSLNKKNL